MQVASNNKFFMLGIPSKNVLGFFSFNHETLTATPLLWLNKVSVNCLSESYSLTNNQYFSFYSIHSKRSMPMTNFRQ